MKRLDLGNRIGPVDWYACRQCGKEKPNTAFSVRNGSRSTVCRGCSAANHNRSMAVTRSTAVVPWPVVVKQYGLTPKEERAVKRAALLMEARDKGGPTADEVLGTITSDLRRQIELAGAACYRAKEMRFG